MASLILKDMNFHKLGGKLDAKSVMFSRLFRAHGQLCASRPWEVIIATITFTACVLSIGWFTNANQRICGWNYQCVDNIPDDIKSSDLIVLTITRCLAVMYIYLQFTNLRKLGSKYLLGIAGVFTIFSSFVFSVVVINLLGSDLTGLNEALPFFLLLVDLSKASALAKFALSSRSQEEVVDNIGRGMAVIGPTLTLDALVETLVIGVGTLSGVQQLETMCCFGCLSVIANYLAFMTFYPACLALVLELRPRGGGRGEKAGGGVWEIYKAVLPQEEEDAKPNPVTQRVKIIMSAGLVLIHIHKRWVASEGVAAKIEAYPGLDVGPPDLSHYISPEESLWQFYLKKMLTPSLDYVITLGLTFMLGMKYVFVDKDGELEEASSSSGVSKESPALEAAGDTVDIDTTSQEWRRRDGCTDALAGKATDALNQAVNSSNNAVNSPADDSPVDESPDKVDDSPDSGFTDLGFTLGGDSDESSSASVETTSTATQTDADPGEEVVAADKSEHAALEPRPLEECLAVLRDAESGPSELTDQEILMLVRAKHIPAYNLENALGDHIRGIALRREIVSASLPKSDTLASLPYLHYDYKYVSGACCENVVGYMPVPVGVAGPLLLNGHKYTVPMATTEGCLVASTNRGCRAIMASGGASSTVVGNGMTRAPVVRFPSAQRASQAKKWLDTPHNFDLMALSFAETSRFARLQKLHVVQAARNLYIRFVATTGDAMGMNMLSKGAERSMLALQESFPDMEILSLSGNLCTDKKPAAINWLEGRGKSVVAEAVIPERIVSSVLKTSTAALVDLNTSKNLMGSAMAASVGGFNAHAANIVTAIYIATGQDPAQNVCSSMCLTVMEAAGEGGEDLFISVTMPSIEIGTVGGGTVLPPQAAALDMLGVRGASKDQPGDNAARLAQVIAATVMAGELSLMSALAAGHLVKSHLKHNRSSINMASPAPRPIRSATIAGTCTQKAP